MILRCLQTEIEKHLKAFPVVAILGPRQCGVPTLAKEIINNNPELWIYLDLERPSDITWISNIFTTSNQAFENVCPLSGTAY